MGHPPSTTSTFEWFLYRFDWGEKETSFLACFFFSHLWAGVDWLGWTVAWPTLPCYLMFIPRDGLCKWTTSLLACSNLLISYEFVSTSKPLNFALFFKFLLHSFHFTTIQSPSTSFEIFTWFSSWDFIVDLLGFAIGIWLHSRQQLFLHRYPFRAICIT